MRHTPLPLHTHTQTHAISGALLTPILWPWLKKLFACPTTANQQIVSMYFFASNKKSLFHLCVRCASVNRETSDKVCFRILFCVCFGWNSVNSVRMWIYDVPFEWCWMTWSKYNERYVPSAVGSVWLLIINRLTGKSLRKTTKESAKQTPTKE